MSIRERLSYWWFLWRLSRQETEEQQQLFAEALWMPRPPRPSIDIPPPPSLAHMLEHELEIFPSGGATPYTQTIPEEN